MAVYGVMQVGRVPLREDSSADLAANDGFVEMTVSGQESFGRLTLVQLMQRVDDVVALKGQLLPVTFTQKPELNGFYQILDATSTYTKWVPESVGIMPWSMKMRRVGYAGDTDLEARLAGPQTRANDHVATGERWHAPNIGHVGYAAGSTLPNVVTRATSDGAMTVYRSLTVGINPRWGTTAANALLGRVRFLDSLGRERVATRGDFVATGWEVHNGLVRVQVNAANGNLILSHWSGAVWQAKEFTVFHSTGPAVAMGVPDYVTVLRNDLESVTVRLTKSLAPGRITVDLTLRRGSRLTEVYVQHQFGTTLKLVRATAEATTAFTGYLRSTAADANGHRLVIGSTRTFVADNVNGGLSKAATPVLDAFVAIEPAAAAAGDLAAQLWAQYLGAASETVKGVRR
jgi:hypothetical protein